MGMSREDKDTMSLSGSSIHGIFQARVLEWGVIAFSAKQNSIFKSLTLTLPSSPFFIFNDPCDYIELTWIVKNNLAISKSLTISTEVETHMLQDTNIGLPVKLHCSPAAAETCRGPHPRLLPN